VLQFTLKSSVFDRSRQLTLNPDYLEFDDRELVNSEPTRFSKQEIEGIRYGVKLIRGPRIYIGRIFCVDIKNREGKVIQLRLQSVFLIRRRQLAGKYVKVVESLFTYYFKDLARSYLQLFLRNEPFEILGVSFNTEGILFDDKIGRIAWDYIGTRKYRTYYAIYSVTEPDRYKAVDYMEHWNASILHSVTEGILAHKFPNRQ